ncbi:hypothetical protein G6F31_016432 [Rhizopus arrhizus]|nr:hypothetical protein G6F31_016432 [Rhizopus arrhizus]
MASQNLPGLAILQAAGYRPPASRIVAATGLLGLLAAPFGAHSVTMGAISAAICTGPEAHPDPAKRYIAAATYGLGYVGLSVVAGAVAVFFQALPAALLAALAGLAGATKTLVFVSATLSDATWQMSGLVILMTLIGGLGTLTGPILGAFIVVLLENKVGDFGQMMANLTGVDWFLRLGESVTIVIGLIFVICVLAFRRGIVGEFGAFIERRRAARA